MKFSDNFKNHFQTSDDHSNKELRSHYYRTRLSEVIKCVKTLIENEKGIIIDENELYNEINYEARGYEATIILTQITPTETAIDFNINTHSLISFGKGIKLIEKFYKYFDTHLNFKGIGLYKG